jgi:hypothetical protein
VINLSLTQGRHQPVNVIREYQETTKNIKNIKIRNLPEDT